MKIIQAKIFCPTHGKLEFDDVIIKDSAPTCRKCNTKLVFGKVQPRRLEPKKIVKRRKRRGKSTKKKGKTKSKRKK